MLTKAITFEHLSVRSCEIQIFNFWCKSAHN